MKRVLGAVAALGLMSGAAHAAPLFTSTFEGDPGNPNYGSYVIVPAADGWTATAGDGIELQNHAAGDPAADGGNVFVELDSNNNSAMSRTLTDAGVYTLSFLYSARPGVAADSNGIDVSVNGLSVFDIALAGGSATDWLTETVTFSAAAGSTLTFAATGVSDSFGGYVDNISVSSAPEPGTWALLTLGVGLAGAALRRRGRALATA